MTILQAQELLSTVSYLSSVAKTEEEQTKITEFTKYLAAKLSAEAMYNAQTAINRSATVAPPTWFVTFRDEMRQYQETAKIEKQTRRKQKEQDKEVKEDALNTRLTALENRLQRVLQVLSAPILE